jgi:hypothetical protein
VFSPSAARQIIDAQNISKAMQEVRDLEIKISFLRTIITASSNNVHDICGYGYDASTCPFSS